MDSKTTFIEVAREALLDEATGVEVRTWISLRLVEMLEGSPKPAAKPVPLPKALRPVAIASMAPKKPGPASWAKLLNLRSVLGAAGLTGSDLAAEIGVEPDTVKAWGSGKYGCSKEKAAQVCAVLKCRLEDLTGEVSQ